MTRFPRDAGPLIAARARHRPRGPWRAHTGLRQPGLLKAGVLTTVIVLLAVATHSLFTIYSVASASMEPTLHCAGEPGCQALNSDRVIAAGAWIFQFRDVKRHDVVVIRTDRPSCIRGKYAIKRVIAVPGDAVASGHRQPAAIGAGSPSVLPKDRYLVAADNPRSSCDSRAFGPVGRSDIVGLVLLVQRGSWDIRPPRLDGGRRWSPGTRSRASDINRLSERDARQ